MKRTILVTTLTLLLCSAFAEDPSVVFRKPFTLRLPVDKEHYYEQECPATPYVADDTVYIFPDERVRVALSFEDGEIKLDYDGNNQSKQYLEFKFWNEPHPERNEIRSFLTAHNITPQNVTYDAAMVIHESPRPLKTTILPIDPWLKNYEQWPYPILQLMLYNFRLVDANAPVVQEAPAKLYAVLFRIQVNEFHELVAFEMDRVIDPTSGSIDQMNIEVPDTYLRAARKHALGVGYQPHIEGGVPVDFYDFYFYNSNNPNEVIRDIE